MPKFFLVFIHIVEWKKRGQMCSAHEDGDALIND